MRGARSLLPGFLPWARSSATGWVTDMAPGGVGARAATHETHVGPPLDEADGAARVLDPIFLHVADPTWRIHGKLWTPSPLLERLVAEGGSFTR